MYTKYVYILFISFFTLIKVNAQSIYPVFMEQFDNGYHFTNPATPLNNNFEFIFTDKKYYGLFENIGVNYFSSRLKINSKSNKINVLGVNFTHEFDGDFLNRNRGNFNYLFQTKVKETAYIGLGMSVGFFNYFVKSTNLNNGVSVLLPDINTGIWYRNKSMNIGFAINQLSSPSDRLFVRTLQLSRFYIFNADYKLQVNSHFNIKPGFIFRKFSKQNTFDLNVISTYNNLINFGINWKIKRGTAFIFGVDNIKIFNQYFGVTASYSVQKISNFSFNSNQFEICLKFLIQK